MYQVEWILENRIVLMRALGDQTVETIEDAVIRLNQHFAAGNAPIHVISDGRYLKRFPVSLSSIKKLMVKNEKSGITVVVGGDNISKFTTKIMVAFGGITQPHFVNTMEEALAILIKADNTLPKQIHYIDNMDKSRTS